MARGSRNWRSFRNILCVRTDNLGDVLMTTPAIKSLKESVPGRRVTLLTSSTGGAITRHIPGIDDVMVFDPPWYRHERHADEREIEGIIGDLQSRQFDAAVIFTVFSQNPLPNAMLCYMAGIPRIAGYCRENPYALMSDWIPDTEPLYGARHEVQRQLDLVTALGATPRSVHLSLDIPQKNAVVQTVLKEAGVRIEQPWILLHPGASESRRCYPPERFAEAASELYAESGLQVVVTGSARERGLADGIAALAGEGVVSVAGQLDMDAFITLVAMAPLLISNNTGPVHIAAAVQTPVVVLYALTNPQHTPWQVVHRVLPFDVPLAKRSRNVLVRFAGERFFPDPAGLPSPRDIVRAARELLDLRIKETAGSRQPVPPSPAIGLTRAG